MIIIGFRWPVRWSDLDSYGHVNNVKYYDYVQEARIALMKSSLDWQSEDIWVIVRQDLEYLKPIDFRISPYEVATLVTQIGTRSFTLGGGDPRPGRRHHLCHRPDRRGRAGAADRRPASGPRCLAGRRQRSLV